MDIEINPHQQKAAELERATDQVKQTQYELHARSAALETAEEALKPFMEAKQAVSNFSTAARDLQVSSSEARSGRGDTIKNLAEEFPLREAHNHTSQTKRSMMVCARIGPS
jgi:hypothetical protein